MVASPMLAEIILLTGEVEGPHLGDMLKGANPSLRVTHVQNADQIAAACQAPPENGRRRLIGFCTPVIVPADILRTLDGQAYNFHPGPPTYPGTHPASFALYEDAARYGVTVHEMAEKVDSGMIVAVDWFDMPPDLRFTDLEMHAFKAAVKMFSAMAARLALDESPLPPSGERWSGRASTRKAFERMREVTDDMDEAEIIRRFRAFG